MNEGRALTPRQQAWLEAFLTPGPGYLVATRAALLAYNCRSRASAAVLGHRCLVRCRKEIETWQREGARRVKKSLLSRARGPRHLLHFLNRTEGCQ